jgi:hypothetical protein
LAIYHDYQRKGYFDTLEKGVKADSGPPRLSVELVPKSCWYDNVRANVSDEDWKALKTRSARRANWRCQICGGQGPKWPVECHEIWSYDDTELIQRLDGLMSLCPSCHEVKHIGLAQLRGRELEATAHLAIVNGWSYEAAESYVAQAFDVWEKRSQMAWSLDVSWLNSCGLQLQCKREAASSAGQEQAFVATSAIGRSDQASVAALPGNLGFWRRLTRLLSS